MFFLKQILQAVGITNWEGLLTDYDGNAQFFFYSFDQSYAWSIEMNAMIQKTKEISKDHFKRLKDGCYFCKIFNHKIVKRVLNMHLEAFKAAIVGKEREDHYFKCQLLPCLTKSIVILSLRYIKKPRKCNYFVRNVQIF